MTSSGDSTYTLKIASPLELSAVKQYLASLKNLNSSQNRRGPKLAPLNPNSAIIRSETVSSLTHIKIESVVEILFILSCENRLTLFFQINCPNLKKSILETQSWDQTQKPIKCTCTENEHLPGDGDILVHFLMRPSVSNQTFFENHTLSDVGRALTPTPPLFLSDVKKSPVYSKFFLSLISKTERTKEKNFFGSLVWSVGLQVVSVILVAAGIALYIENSNKKNKISPVRALAQETPLADSSSMDEAEINLKIEQALKQNMNSKVVYNDVLGEGENSWDTDPRYPEESVNCVVWFRKLISDVYGSNLEEKKLIMDRLRYYGGKPSFSLRKHFGSRWMALDPEPLLLRDLSWCAKPRRKVVELDLHKFLKSHAYSCPLYKMDQHSIEVDYVSPEGLVDCAKRLSPGYYFMFGLASHGYNRVYGQKSGPMGLVHGMVLKLEGQIEKNSKSTNRPFENMTIYHASISSKKVESEPLVNYIRRMKKRRHDGYAVYSLDPEWDFSKEPPIDLASDALAHCEKEITVRGASRSVFSLR